MSDTLKCCICGKPATMSCCSLNNTTRAYCDDCMDTGIIPYSDLVGMCMYTDDFNEEVMKNVVIPTLDYFEKSIEEFNKDVGDFILEEMNYRSGSNHIFYEEDDYDDDYYWDPYDNS